MADDGCKYAQGLYIYGLAEGTYGIEQNPEELKRLAERRKIADLDKPYNELDFLMAHDRFYGNYYNSYYVYLEGLAEGKYGIEQSPTELKRLAEIFRQSLLAIMRKLGIITIVDQVDGFSVFFNSDPYTNLNWEVADLLYTEGLAEGNFGIEKSLDRLKELGANGSFQANLFFFARTIAEQDLDTLINLATEGCPFAQFVYIEGLAEGKYGITQNHGALKRLAERGWISAQPQYFEALLMQDKNTEAVLLLNDVLLEKIEKETAMLFKESAEL